MVFMLVPAPLKISAQRSPCRANADVSRRSSRSVTVSRCDTRTRPLLPSRPASSSVSVTWTNSSFSLQAVGASHNDYAPPSTIGGSTELDALERFSCVICDSLTLASEGQRLKSASVSRRLLAGIMANPTSFGRMKFSIEQARMYQNEDLGIRSGFSKTQLQVTKAMVNVAGLLLESSVEQTGRVGADGIIDSFSARCSVLGARCSRLTTTDGSLRRCLSRWIRAWLRTRRG